MSSGYVLINVEPGAETSVFEQLSKLSFVSDIYHLFGDYDIIIKIEAEHPIKVDEINVEDYAQKSSVEKALLLHDTNDRVLPVEKSREVTRKWPAASIIEVTETGHYKILGAEKVLDKVMDFLIH